MPKLHIDNERKLDCIIIFSNSSNTNFIVFVEEEKRFYYAKIFPAQSSMLWKQPDNNAVITLNSVRTYFYF